MPYVSKYSMTFVMLVTVFIVRVSHAGLAMHNRFLQE